MQYYIIDAFSDQLFKGNQAGVCILDEWLSDELMQSIAFENNLAETAFVVKRAEHFDLRWFTPVVEMDLCGHATLASAFVVANFVDASMREIKFNTRSGMLVVKKNDDWFEMDFPSRKPKAIEVTELMEQAVGVKILEAYQSRDMLLIVENQETVRNLKPEQSLVSKLPDSFGLIVSAVGQDVDFVSRFFAPNAGILEDPVTGSSHATLIPFWSERFGKDKMVAEQLSKRGGTLICENCGDRVKISGKATLYLEGKIRTSN